MKNLTLNEYELFSAYLDGQLTPAETKRLEDQLQANLEWRLALDELSATRKLLRSAPRYRAPRNFTLTPEMARQNARKSWLPSFVTFRFSTAMATLSILAVLGLQVFGGRAPLLGNLAAAPASEATFSDMTEKSAQESAPQMAAPEAAVTGPAAEAQPAAADAGGGGVITWGGTPNGQMNLGGYGGGGAPDTSAGIVGFKTESYGAFGRGGGGGGDGVGEQYYNPAGIVTYGGQSPPASMGGSSYVLPQQAVPQTEMERTASGPAEESAPVGNPILGVQSGDAAGQVIGTETYNNLSVPPPSFEPAPDRSASAVQPGFWDGTRIAQAALLALGVLFAAAAVTLRRRG